MDRTILHCDMNGFFASVELLARPDLKDVPMAVCGSPDNRHGIILAKNEIAKAYGVTTAETLWQARRKCPELQIVPPHHDKYKQFSLMINSIYQRYTDLVEPFSIDESWLDVTASKALFGDGKKIADEIRETVKKELGLTLSAGVSYNKIFAKMGSDYKKPDATTVISRENYRDLLWPLPAGDMFFCGRKTAEKLAMHGIRTIGDIACADEAFLVSLLGKHGSVLHAYTNGLDEDPVSHYGDKRPVKSIGNGITFRRNLTSIQDIEAAILHLADTVAVRLRHHELKASGVKVDIKDEELKTISRQAKLDRRTDLAQEIYRSALSIVQGAWPEGKPIRMLTITAINLSDEEDIPIQLSIFDAPPEVDKKSEDLERAMDSIREKFGKNVIQFGKPDRNDLGLHIAHDEED